MTALLAAGCLVGNCVLTPTMLQWFFTYMSGFIVIMFLMFQTVNVLKFTIWLVSTRWHSTILDSCLVSVCSYNQRMIRAISWSRYAV